MVAVGEVCSHYRYFDFRVKYLWLILYLVDRCQTEIYLFCAANGCSVRTMPEDGRKLPKHVAPELSEY